MRFKLSIFTVLAATFLASTMATAAEEPSEQVKRMDAAATVLDEIMGTPDKGIPQELLDSAKCVAVIPSMVKIGFVFGGRHGRGLATCRTRSGWSAPAPFSVTGGSWGLQIGGEAVDDHDRLTEDGAVLGPAQGKDVDAGFPGEPDRAGCCGHG